MHTFVVMLSNKSRQGLARELLLAHIGHLRKLHAAGALVICGPFADGESALLILRTPDRQEAETIVKADPFIISGYYGSYALHEMIEGNEANNWLLEDA
jgi:uncharacterized protein